MEHFDTWRSCWEVSSINQVDAVGRHGLRLYAHADLDHAPEAGLAAGQAEDDAASGLGALKAAHASPQALANADPNSRVGRIETYKEALDRYLSDLNAGARPAVLSADITATGIALAAAANKTVTTEAVDQLNGLLGVSTVSDPNWESRTSPDIVAVANGPYPGRHPAPSSGRIRCEDC